MPLNHRSQYAELTDEHFKAIGKLTVEWSNIEYLLGVSLSRLLVTPEVLARTYTDHMSAATRQDAIKEAAEIHRYRYSYKLISEDLIKQILEINNQITQLKSTRNKFAHFCWSRSSDDEISAQIYELAESYQSAYAIVDVLSEIVKRLAEMGEEGLTALQVTRYRAAPVVALRQRSPEFCR